MHTHTRTLRICPQRYIEKPVESTQILRNSPHTHTHAATHTVQRPDAQAITDTHTHAHKHTRSPTSSHRIQTIGGSRSRASYHPTLECEECAVRANRLPLHLPPSTRAPKQERGPLNKFGISLCVHSINTHAHNTCLHRETACYAFCLQCACVATMKSCCPLTLGPPHSQ